MSIDAETLQRMIRDLSPEQREEVAELVEGLLGQQTDGGSLPHEAELVGRTERFTRPVHVVGTSEEGVGVAGYGLSPLESESTDE
ncbi:MAG: hypothetical protein O3A46_16610 [Candidatus Poribacteria bacterium]|nr:hypothetical protein [Candidatus Poribacteria bacterium]